MSPVTVEHDGGDRFVVTVRDHQVVVDQPADVGGDDSGPTPTELFVGSLAACIAFYGRRFLARHGLAEDVKVTAEYEMSDDRPARVASVRVFVDADVPAARQAAFERVVDHCTVSNSLRQPPHVDLQVRLLSAA